MRYRVLASTVSLLAGCGSRTGINTQICEEGRQIACACPGGAIATQVCLPGGSWSACTCPTPGSSVGGSQGDARSGVNVGTGGRSGSGGMLASGGRMGGSGGSGGGAGRSGYGGVTGAPDAAVGTGIQIAQGASRLLDVLVGAAGIYVVTADDVVLLDRTGSEKARVTAARQITSAAFDGSTLVVADRGKLTSYDVGLGVIVSADLLEACAASVMIGQSRFVCGPSNDWDRVFYTYDAKTGQLLASSKKYTYHGIPMRRVPGTDDFVTVSVGTSPSDFFLYTVFGNGEASYVNESPYHGAFAATMTFAFDGAPPTHLINSSGLLLKMNDPGCSADAGFASSTCFLKDGALGTLTGSQYFAAMDSDAAGIVYALVDSPSDSFSSDLCTKACMLQKINVADRTVVSQSNVQLKAASIVAFRHDATAGAAVVGYVVGTGKYYSPSDPYPGYRVVVMPY